MEKFELIKLHFSRSATSGIEPWEAAECQQLWAANCLIILSWHLISSYHLLHEVPGVRAERRGWRLEALDTLDCVVDRQQEREHRVFWKQTIKSKSIDRVLLRRCCYPGSYYSLWKYEIYILQSASYTSKDYFHFRIWTLLYWNWKVHKTNLQEIFVAQQMSKNFSHSLSFLFMFTILC